MTIESVPYHMVDELSECLICNGEMKSSVVHKLTIEGLVGGEGICGICREFAIRDGVKGLFRVAKSAARKTFIKAKSMERIAALIEHEQDIRVVQFDAHENQCDDHESPF